MATGSVRSTTLFHFIFAHPQSIRLHPAARKPFSQCYCVPTKPLVSHAKPTFHSPPSVLKTCILNSFFSHFNLLPSFVLFFIRLSFVFSIPSQQVIHRVLRVSYVEGRRPARIAVKRICIHCHCVKKHPSRPSALHGTTAFQRRVQSVVDDIPGSTISSRVDYVVATCLLLAVQVASNHRFVPEDVNSELMCEGTLAEHAACQCKQVEGDISCINAQFVDTNVFLNIASNYRSLQSVTFHGNNFQDLPSTPLFGRGTHDFLLRLNISANYIVNLHPNALKGMPNLQVLDMSNNEIVLKTNAVDFLTHTPHLTQLFLRRAFTATVNRTVQFDLMMDMFRKANLETLEVLDLSYNFLQSVPYSIACPFPALQTLDLRQNFLKSFDVNVTCLKNVHTINLSRNQFFSIPLGFQQMADRLAPQTFLMRNPLNCDCESREYIAWVRSTNAIRDRSTLVCGKASPSQFEGAKLIELPVKELTCNERLTRRSDPTYIHFCNFVVAALLAYVCT